MAQRPQADEPSALTAAEIAVLVGGKLDGDGTVRISGVAPLDRAGPDQLTFLADKRYAGMLASSKAGAILVAPEFGPLAESLRARIAVAKPHDALISLLPKFYRAPRRGNGIHASAVVDAEANIGGDVTIDAGAVVERGASIGARSWIGPNCVIGEGVSIGEDSRLVANVTCYPGSVLGARVTIHAGSTVGSDGFGYSFARGAHQKIPHVGRCIIGDDVEIGANSCIDRGSIDDTVIGAGTKIDNLVHVAHNVHIGRLCLLMGQVGIAGSTHVEDGVIIAGQTGVTGHVTVGAGARIAGRSGVISDVPAGETWSGFPARPHREWLRSQGALNKLSNLLKRMERFLDQHE